MDGIGKHGVHSGVELLLGGGGEILRRGAREKKDEKGEERNAHALKVMGWDALGWEALIVELSCGQAAFQTTSPRPWMVPKSSATYQGRGTM